MTLPLHPRAVALPSCLTMRFSRIAFELRQLLCLCLAAMAAHDVGPPPSHPLFPRFRPASASRPSSGERELLLIVRAACWFELQWLPCPKSEPPHAQLQAAVDACLLTPRAARPRLLPLLS